MQALVTFAVNWQEAKVRLQSFLGDESGATAMEYVLLASGIGIGILVAVATLGSIVGGAFTDIANAISFN